MDPQTWQQIEYIFQQALEAPPNQRLAIVQSLAGGDSQIFEEVVSLLNSHTEEDGLFAHDSTEPLRLAVQKAMELLQDSSDQESKTQEKVVGIDLHADHVRQLVQSLGAEFEFIELIGKGGMGFVVQVRDRQLDRHVALKLIQDSDLHPQRRRRFLQESRALAKLDSEHIVDIHRVSDGPVPFIVMEWIRGPSLRTVLNRRKRLGPRFAAEIARQIAIGLHHAHSAGLVHRDIKPGNILLQRKSSTQPQWRVKLVDFGLARSDEAQHERTLEETIAGTPVYMSPEHFTGISAVDRRSDVYATGITLYEMLVGEPPFRGPPHMILRQIEHHDPRPLREWDDRIPKDLESICLKAIAKHPQNRYQTAEQLTDDLGRYLNGLPTLARPVSHWTRTYRWMQRNPRLALSLALVASLLMLIAIGSSIASSILWRKNHQIALQQQRFHRALCERAATADPDALPFCIEQIATQVADPLPTLRELWEIYTDQRARLNLACARTALGDTMSSFILDQIGATKTTPGQCRSISIALSKQPTAALTALTQRYEHAATDTERFKLAVLALELSVPERKNLQLATQLTEPSVSPDARTTFVHQLANWYGRLDALIGVVDPSTPAHLTSAVCLGLGLMEPQNFDRSQSDELQRRLLSLHSLTEDSGLRSAIRWVAGRRALDLPAQHALPFEMILIHSGEFAMGNDDPTLQYAGRTRHAVQLTRDYWIADREVHVGLYREFLADKEYPEDEKPLEYKQWSADPTVSPTANHPVQKVSWADAVRFCNWLSRKHQLTPVYQKVEDVALADANGKMVAMENWVRDFEANGYRLPTEAEFEFACRAGTTTRYSFGDDQRYREHYAATSNNTLIPANAVATLLPNAWGLFDTHGNVWEWAEDWWRDFPDESEVDPCGSTPELAGRAYRGGGVCNFSGDPVSCCRGSARPDARYRNLGFRVARNAP